MDFDKRSNGAESKSASSGKTTENPTNGVLLSCFGAKERETV